MELRDYQVQAGEAVFDYFAEQPNGSPLVVLPTGSGKSLCVADLIRRVLLDEPGEHCLVLSHRREILEQNSGELQALIPHLSVGVFSAGLGQKRMRQVTVAGVQSLARVRQLPPFRLVIIDECHLVPRDGEGAYLQIIKKLRESAPDTRIVGYSATPFRMGSGYLHKGDGRLFTDIAFEISVRELIAAGYLVPLVTKHTATQADLAGVKTRGGEYVPGEAERAVDTDELVGAAVAEMIRYGAERKSWLVFCAGIKHAKHVHEVLSSNGVNARCLFGDTPSGARAMMLREFKAQRLRAIVSVDCLTTGFNAPCTDMIAMLRPTRSTGLWVQALGRGTRLSSETGKKDCLVLDFCNSVEQCGTIDNPIVRQPRKKGEKEEKQEAPVKVCPDCQSCLATAVRVCPDCQYEFPEPELKHAPVASTAPVMGRREPQVFAVTKATYHRHEKIKERSVSVSFRVDYRTAGLGPSVSEWICFEHRGEPRWKAERWWRRHARASFEEPPKTVAEAMERRGQLKPPVGIAVEKNGSYYEVVRVIFEDSLLNKDCLTTTSKTM